MRLLNRVCQPVHKHLFSFHSNAFCRSIKIYSRSKTRANAAFFTDPYFCVRLPGEAMQIDRVMDSFAAHYCAQNPNIFEERDTCFILSFSIIMLNTALHNPNAKIKISAEQFVKQNRGINSGKDLPNDMLEAIYRNIKEEPFKIPDETYDDLMYTFFSPEREGWLEKQVGPC